MKPLYVDLGRSRAGVPQVVVATVSALMLLASALAWNGYRIRSALPPAVPAAADAALPAPLESPAYAQDAAVWLEVARSPWDAVFGAIEATAVPDVRIIGLDIDALARSVTVEIDAPDHAATSAWFAELSGSAPDLRWQLQQSRKSGTRVVAVGAGRW